MSFPTSPADQQIATVGGYNYQYSFATNTWTRLYSGIANSSLTLSATTDSTGSSSGALIVTGGAGIGANVYVAGNVNAAAFRYSNGQIATTRHTTSSTAPANPNVGDFWYCTLNDVMLRYTYDGGSYYWVDIISPTFSNFSPSTTSIANAAYGINTVANGALSVTGNLIPTSNSAYALGSSSFQFANLYAANLVQNGTPVNRFFTGNTAPAGVNTGDTWYRGNTDTFYSYVQDAANNRFWLDLSTNPSSFGNLTVTGNITAGNVNVTGNISFGGINSTGTIVANGFVSNYGGQLIGYLTGAIGANTANTGRFTTVTTTSNISLGGNIVFSDSTAFNSANSLGTRNRIINGDMRIDQRNNGASQTTSTTSTYMVDRWYNSNSQNTKYTVQQNAGSVTPPVGFTNYLGATSTSAYSLLSNDYFLIAQVIEGLNVSDLAWGTANAKTVTLSFQVYSSLTGTFGGSLRNSAANRSYPFAYTISSANTWTSVSITIPGDTTGIWLTTNGVGIQISFSLGMGSTFSGTAGAWAGANYASVPGATSVVGTSSATFYITGVQLEASSVATPFERRSYGQELMLCQRYCNRSTVGTGTYGYFPGFGSCDSTTTAQVVIQFPVPMRSYGNDLSLTTTGTAAHYSLYVAGSVRALSVVPTLGSSQSTGDSCQITCTIGSAALVAGQAAQLLGTVANSPYLLFSTEL